MAKMINVTFSRWMYTNVSCSCVAKCNNSWAVAKMGDRLATIDMGRRVGAAVGAGSSSNLSRRRSDVCHTSTHGVALVRISDAGLKPPARRLLKTQDAKKSPFAHHRTNLSAYIFASKARIDIRKKLIKQQCLSTCPHNMANFGPL